MVLNTLSKGRKRPESGGVSTLQDTDKSSLAIFVCNFDQLVSHPLKFKLCDPCVAAIVKVVLLMSIETGRNKYHIWLEVNKGGN